MHSWGEKKVVRKLEMPFGKGFEFDYVIFNFKSIFDEFIDFLFLRVTFNGNFGIDKPGRFIFVLFCVFYFRYCSRYSTREKKYCLKYNLWNLLMFVIQHAFLELTYNLELL